jgi:tetratricopeptide (TPR) repeat protein
MKTKEIPVFLSANKNLEEERQVIENVCYRKSKEMIGKLFFAVVENRLENPELQENVDYYQAIRESELFISLFGREMKKIKKEFKIAYQNYQEKKKPSIYTYLKDETARQSEIDIKSFENLKGFEKYLQSLGRSSMSYKNLSDLRVQIYKILGVFIKKHQLQLPKEKVDRVIVKEMDKKLAENLEQTEIKIKKQTKKLKEFFVKENQKLTKNIELESQIRQLKLMIVNLEQQQIATNEIQIKELEREIGKLKIENEKVRKELKQIQTKLKAETKQQEQNVQEKQPLKQKEKQILSFEEQYKGLDPKEYHSEDYLKAYGLILDGKTEEADLFLNTERLNLQENTEEERRELAKKFILKAILVAYLKNDYQKANSYFDKALKIYEDADFYSEYAAFSEFQNDFNKAVLNYQKAYMIYQNLSHNAPEVFKPKVAKTLHQLAMLHKETPHISLQIYQESLKIYEELFQENPKVYKANLVIILIHYGLLQESQSNFNEAVISFQSSLKYYQELFQENSKTYKSDLASTLMYYATLQNKQGNFSEAETSYQTALKYFEELFQENPKTYKADLASTLVNYGRLQNNQRNFNEAAFFFQSSLKYFEELFQENPKTYKADLAKNLTNYGNLQSSQYDLKGATVSYQTALKYYQELFQENQKLHKEGLALTLLNYANLQHKQENFSEALTSYENSLKYFEELFQENPKAYKAHFAGILMSCANLQSSQGDFNEAKEKLSKSLFLFESLAKTYPQAYNIYIAHVWINFAAMYWYKQDIKKCEDYLDKAEPICRRYQNHQGLRGIEELRNEIYWRNPAGAIRNLNSPNKE